MSVSVKGWSGSCRGRSGWSVAIAEWQESGVSAEEFCRRRGLVRSTFQWWRWRLSRENAERPEAGAVPALVPVRVVSVAPFAPDPVASVMELDLPSGVRLRVPSGFDERTVAGVLWALEAVGSC